MQVRNAQVTHRLIDMRICYHLWEKGKKRGSPHAPALLPGPPAVRYQPRARVRLGTRSAPLAREFHSNPCRIRGQYLFSNFYLYFLACSSFLVLPNISTLNEKTDPYGSVFPFSRGRTRRFATPPSSQGNVPALLLVPRPTISIAKAKSQRLALAFRF